MIIGSHVNFGKEQLLGATKQAISFGANTFMFYTGAPQNTVRKDIDDRLTKEAIQLMKENNMDIKNVICHAPYIINLANKEKEEAWHFSIDFLKRELKRVEALGVTKVVVHPGNALKLDKEKALKNISEALNKVLEKESQVKILIETMAGKGSECGQNIEEIQSILKQIEKKDRIGVCLDTCHLHDSGIDIGRFEAYLKAFDEQIGIEKIGCIHLNDSKNILGSKKDRHANLGYGMVGFEKLISVAYNETLKNVPKILETPWINEYPPYKIEIEMLKKKEFNPHLEDEIKFLYSK